jgi:hypothetical protein
MSFPSLTMLLDGVKVLKVATRIDLQIGTYAVRERGAGSRWQITGSRERKEGIR